MKDLLDKIENLRDWRRDKKLKVFLPMPDDFETLLSQLEIGIKKLAAADIFAIDPADPKFEVIEFAYKVAKAFDEIGSSHVYFMMQQAFEKNKSKPEISWEECSERFENIITLVEASKAHEHLK